MKASTCLFLLGILIIVPAIYIEVKLQGRKTYKPADQARAQEQIKLTEKTKLLDPKTGKIQVKGWGNSIASKIEVNLEDSLPIHPALGPLNLVKNRAFNFMMIYTEKHVFQIVMANLQVACSTTVIVAEKADPEKTKLRQETMFACPKLDLNSLDLTEASIDTADLKLKFLHVEGDRYEISIDAKSIDVSGNFMVEASGVDGFIWALPLSEDHQTFFAN